MKLTNVLLKPNRKIAYAKAKFSVIGSVLLLAFSAQGAGNNYDNLSKQLNIMNDIMMSSAKSAPSSRQTLIRSIDSIYLQGQGAIFTISSAHVGSSHHQFFQIVAPLAPRAPKGPKAEISSSESTVIINEDFDMGYEEHEDEFERVIEIFEQQREGARELRSEEREIHYEMRDIARQQKDIEYQLQRAEKTDKNELTSELKKLEVERVNLVKNKTKLEQKVTELNKQREQQNIAQSKARAEHFNAVNNALVETLCLYGNGLRAVPSQEHISLIIKGAGDKQGRNYKDQILVFNKKDINACANSKLTAKKLLTKAEQYQF